MNNCYQNVAIFQWNANSLRSKWADFRKLVAQFSFPVLCITEAGVDNVFRLANYVVYTSSRSSGLSRAMICVRRDLPSALLSATASDIPEYVACEVRFGRVNITIVSVYLQPSTNISFSTLTGLFQKYTKNVIFCGDFNAHHVMWGSAYCDRRGNELEKAIQKSGLCLLNDGSVTFLRGFNYSSCLDLTLCSNDIACGAPWRTDIETRGSGHFPILIQHPRLRFLTYRRSAKITNWQAFRYHITSQADAVSDTDSLLSLITDKLNLCSKFVKIPDGYAGVDSEYERLRAIRRRAERKYRRTGLLEDYRECQKVYDRMGRQLERLGTKRWQEFCTSLTPFTPESKLWNVLRSLSGPVTHQQPFRALALVQKVPETTIANEFCQLITRPSAAVNTSEYSNSVEEVKASINFSIRSDHHDLDQPFSLE